MVMQCNSLDDFSDPIKVPLQLIYFFLYLLNHVTLSLRMTGPLQQSVTIAVNYH